MVFSLDFSVVALIWAAEVFVFSLFLYWLRFEPQRIEASKVRIQLLNDYFDSVKVQAERKE